MDERGTPVTLVDGRVVSSYSEEWRHECECTTLLRVPTLEARRSYLYGSIDKWGKPAGGILQRRGEAAVKQMEATMLALWNARKV